jgi:hypothetical protein
VVGVSRAMKQHDVESSDRGSACETLRGRVAWLPFWLPEGHFGRDFEKENALTREFVRPSGFEPETCGLRLSRKSR